jgi:hypothetical protein
MNNTYKLSPGGFKCNRLIWIPAVTFIITILLLFYFNRSASNNITGNTPLIITIAILAIILPIRVIRNYRQQRAAYDSYRLIITDNEIIKEQASQSRVVIPFTGVVRVVHADKGGMLIRSINPEEYILVPYTLERYEEIEAKMRTIIAFSAPERSFFKRYKAFFLLAAMFILFIVFGQAKDKRITITSGGLLLPMLIWCITYVSKHKTINRFTLLVLFLVTLSVLGMMVAMIFGII